MFERNPIESGRMTGVAVAISLKDGETVTGKAGLPHGRSVARLLEGTEDFLFVETFEGGQAFVPKSEIKALKILDTSRPQPLRAAVTDAKGYDPHAVLGIERGASLEAVKAAYHKMTRAYHPDAFAGVTLPPEVAAYLEQRCKQINAAFELLKITHRAKLL